MSRIADRRFLSIDEGGKGTDDILQQFLDIDAQELQGFLPAHAGDYITSG